MPLHLNDLADAINAAENPEAAAKDIFAQLRAQGIEGEATADNVWHDWKSVGRDEQKPPPGDWQFWLFMAGRGAGKTRAGAEWVKHKVMQRIRHIALIAPTADSARKVMIEGDSGILEGAFEGDIDIKGEIVGRPVYEPSKRQLHWSNGSVATIYTAEEPERLRGPQHGALWADELASWPRSKVRDNATEAWDNAMFGLRIGLNPQAMISTTPKPIPIIRELIRQSLGDNPTCVITRATTYANRAALASPFYSRIIQRYEGTRLGRQELLGEVIDEMEGALWSGAIIDQARLHGSLPDMRRIVIGVDPAVTVSGQSSLTGIVVAGLGVDGLVYVLADLSGRLSPDRWAKVVIRAYDEFEADRIVAEGNQGGELVRVNINTVRKNMPIRIVHARHSKQARAEPVSALYEQGKVRHAKPFPELELQMTTWEPLGGEPSPDRLDAMVWAITDLALKGATYPPIVSPVVVGQPRYWPGSGEKDW
jgi:phage terminase large subunit-like protein